MLNEYINTNVRHILWRVYLEMLGTYSVRGIPGYTCYTSNINRYM